jgi:hypothetical protein
VDVCDLLLFAEHALRCALKEFLLDSEDLRV